jgi:Cu2+-exporting ATPase
MNANAASVLYDEARCFHCNEPLNGSTLRATIGDREEPVCCAGCRAVAELIASTGLMDYYRYREQPAPRPQATTDVWSAYERPEIASEFTETLDARVGATLLLEGLRCAACSWLIDKTLLQLPGVLDVSVNTALGRARIEWDPARTQLAEVLRTIAALGYRPQPLTAASIAVAKQDESRQALKRLAVAGLGMMQVMMFAVATYSADMTGEVMDATIWNYFRLISLLVSTPVLLYAGAPILSGAWRSLRAHAIGMDVPVSIALMLAYGASVWNTWRGAGEVYFDSVTMFVFFLTLGRWVEMTVRHRTTGITDALARHLPATAHKVNGEQVAEVPTAQLTGGDVVLVRTGEIVPADAVLLQDEAHLDESMLTGESQAVARKPGERISAGTLNVGKPLRARVVAVGRATLLSGIVNLLQRAQTQKPTMAQAADRAAGHFLGGVLSLAALVCAVWLAFDPTQAFAATLAVLVVACPCAFAIATPAALSAATGQLARRGILLTRPDVIEALAAIDRVIFDKTGTLTRGEMRIERIDVLGTQPADRCAALAAALERESAHPISRAFKEVAASFTAMNVSVRLGAGIEGWIDGKRYRLGTPAFAAELCGAPIVQRTRIAETEITLASDTELLAVFVLADTLREGSQEVSRRLAALGISSEILSGDALPAVTSVAQACAIDTFQARCSPEQKLDHVRSLQAKGVHVAMLGDGINDAPVLGAANVSIAMGKGAALAHASADMILIREDLSALPHAICTARRTLRIARQNLCWAAVYNFGSLPLAALGFIPPWLAALGMSLSSIVVILNATRLLSTKPAGRSQVRPRRPLDAPPIALRTAT